MIKAVIFDCFGVLVSESWHSFMSENFDEEQTKEAERLMLLSSSGKINQKQFISMVASLSGKTPSEVEAEIYQSKPNLRLFKLITQLKERGLKIGVLSNAADNYFNVLFSAEQNKLFDSIVLSCDVGAVKPEPKMYQLILEKLGVEPSEAVFFDDIETYVEGAEALGIKAFVFNSSSGAEADMKSLGLLSD